MFALLDEEASAILAGQVEVRQFEAGRRIYKTGEPAERAYVVVSGKIRVASCDDANQEVLLDELAPGEFFGFSPMLEKRPHESSAIAAEDSVCVEITRQAIATLLERKPLAGLDLMTVLGRQFHAAQQLVRARALRNLNQIYEERATAGGRLADAVARFGGSWKFLIVYAVAVAAYVFINERLGRTAWDPYPFLLLNLSLNILSAVQAPIIMMSQNRQEAKDRTREQLDYAVNRRSESEIIGLALKLHLIGDQLDSLQHALRSRAGG